MNKPIDQVPIPFVDLQAQRRRLGTAIDAAVLRAVHHGTYIMGPEVKQIEAELAAFCGAREVVSCASGTDALLLVLMAKGVRSGDAVICPSFTFAATAEAIVLAGATPVFVDVQADTFNMDGESLKQGLVEARRQGLKPVGVIPVDLFGQPADYDTILPIAEDNGLWVLCDAAQSFGATERGRRVGTFGLATAVSFYPAKPLGCYGDGGAVFTDDAELAAVMRSLRVHGEGADRYDNVRVGLNGRLDTIQAAVLIEKLKIFPDEIRARERIAARYAEGLNKVCTPPRVRAGATSVWAQYTIRVARRDSVAARLKERGIPTAIYYPKPLHRQTAYRRFPVAGGALDVSDMLAAEVLSLPMHAYLAPDAQDRITADVAHAARG
jgi:dTDP-4-amino-4,6-dideoxygalactose transaminase